MTIAEKLDAARLRAGVWMRERAERAQVRRMEKRARAAADPHGASRFWLLNVPAIATILAAVVEWYWAMLFCIEATGRVDWNWETAFGSQQAAASTWNFAFSAHLPVLLGLLFATAPIVMLSMIWLPTQFAMRGAGRWRRGTLIFVGLLANILVIISGTVVMNYNRQDQVREALVVEQSADAQRSMLVASVEDLRDELNTLMTHPSRYIATAASVGATAYERDYVQQARATNDPRLPLLERALGAARRADELRQQIREARANVAQAAPVAASQANVQDNVGVGLNTFAQYAEVYRPPFVAVICTLIGIFGTWWVIAMLERLNPRDVLRSGWASDAERIEDLRDQEPVAAQPPVPLREDIVDADTGERLTRVKPHLRKVRPRKGVPQKVEIRPDPEPDERGVTVDGGQRIGTGNLEQLTDLGTVSEVPSVHDDAAKHQENGDNHSPTRDATFSQEPIQDEPPSVDELTDEEVAAIEAELAVTSDGDSSESGSPSPYGDGSDNRSEAQDESSEHDSHEPESNGIFVHDSSPSENNEQPDHADSENGAGQEAEGDDQEQGEPGFQYAEGEAGPVKPRGLIAAE